MSAAKERIISERVVSRKVIGSANPIARKFRNLKGSFGGVCIAPVLIILALGILFWGERMKKSSAVVESLSLENAEEVTADSGMHKISGTAADECDNKPTYFSDETGNVLYYTYDKEEYRLEEETEYETVTKIEGGQEIEETVERVKEVEKWVSVESDSKWCDFKLGDYTVSPDGVDMEVSLEKISYKQDYLGDYTEKATTEDEIGDEKVTLQYLPMDSKLIVVGEISGKNISGGDPFIITTKSDSELIEDMKAEETAIYWVTKGASWLLLMFGFMSILSPILSLLDFIPIAGKAASCAASIIGAILALIIVFLATVIIKFWWLFLIIAVLAVGALVALIIVLVSKKGSSNKEGEKVEKKE